MKTTVCSKCIYDTSIKNITFNEEGVCDYCLTIDDLQRQYKTGTSEGEAELFRIIAKIKKEGKGKKYDCILGVSGGTDSSYMIAKAVEWGLRPLAVHYDNTWNSTIATENIGKVLGKLKVDLYTYVIDNKEADDIFRAFFISNVSDLDASSDLAMAEVMYRAASKYNVKYVLEGHSFMAEGVSPLANSYMDGKYIKTIHQLYGKQKMKTFPNMEFGTFMKWLIFKRIKKIRPLWYINYSKKAAQKFLEKEFDWKYYGGHHLENRLSAFSHSYYLPKKFNIDQRNNSLSAEVRSKVKSREEALKEYSLPPYLEPELINYFKKRLELSNEEFEKIMNGPKKSFRDYKTYKKRFERLRPFFYILAKANLVPMSFYLKYCSSAK